MIAIAAEEDGPGIGRIRMRRICDASAENLMPFVEDFIEPGGVVHADGWLGYLLLEAKGQVSGWRQSRSHGRRGQNKATADRGRPTIKG
jgi:hypothetical protein